MLNEMYEEWVPIAEALPQLRRYFRTKSALLHHLRKRETNGLATAGAVRKSPLGMLLVNPGRIRAWAMGEQAKAA